jgi:hypothetical protein
MIGRNDRGVAEVGVLLKPALRLMSYYCLMIEEIKDARSDI